MNYQSFDFEGRKPSKAQILSKAQKLAESGAHELEIFWGENFITLVKHNSNKWLGLCHIKDISGESIATELNKKAEAI